MNARSRLPVQVSVSGAASKASISGLVRNPINVWLCFFDGIDKTCWITSDRVGSSNDAYRKNDRMAVRRRLRLRALLFRFCSRSAKNALINWESRSSRASVDGSFFNFTVANWSKRRNVSRYEAIVCGLTRRSDISRFTKKRSNKEARLLSIGMPHLPSPFEAPHG